MRPIVLLLTFATIAINSPPPADAQGKKEPLVGRVKTSIDLGVRFLRGKQLANGSWEVNIPSAGVQGGWSSLAVLALLNSGVPVNDPAVKRGLEYVRSLQPTMTYVRALQTMVLVEAGLDEDRERIVKNVEWLIKARVIRGGKLMGWTYNQIGASEATDNSNTQYALLGLWAGKQGGVEINREIWESIRDYYLRTQEADGAWDYSARYPKSNVTMTSAGLCGILIAGMGLNVGREEILDNGTATNCGVYEENPAAAKAITWIRNRFILNLRDRTFYHLYGLERAGRLTGQRFIGGHDWYREGCEYLVEQQKTTGPDAGSWYTQGPGFDSWPVVSTSFALLFLSKGRTPVLISKAVHGPWNRSGRIESDTDWNNDRNDLRHLVEFSSKELFKKLPLNWQIFDMARSANEAVTEEDLVEPVSELLQSPILYITGHQSPQLRFNQTEKTMLKLYIDNGGFILAEACCGSPAFDGGFKALVAQLWPDNELKDLPGDHPVWKSHFVVGPGNPFQLMGLSLGCKTVLIYSPQDLSCLWESGSQKEGKHLKAFQLGANIVSYATGMEPPQPRLTPIDVANPKDDQRSGKRGYFQAAQLEHRGDWQPAPRAMRNLLDHLRKFAGLDVSLKTETMKIFNESIKDFKFVYMHGRRDFAFREEDGEELQHLRFNLQNGGMLFADACCGQEAFDKAFRKFVAKLLPGHKLEQVPFTDALFSKELNGEALTRTNIRVRQEKGGPLRNVDPFLEGVKIGDRWVVLYSKYDIGCALEKHQSPECRGYDNASALKIASAAVLYLLEPADKGR
ncbi:MAG: DUF4159 domain-containing protein [Planctomycetes bacterium]|nr:DUF4159 domain-containing protein [Planctomycetota bacterium]